LARFGGNEFTGFSVPLMFEGRYFILEPGDPPLVTVFVEREGQPVFEVMKNRPVANLLTQVSMNATGVVTVSEKVSGRFLYKIRPGSDTSVAFGKLGGGEISARITDRSIQAGDTMIQNSAFSGEMTGLVVDATGSIGIGAKLPPLVRSWLSSQ